MNRTFCTCLAMAAFAAPAAGQQATPADRSVRHAVEMARQSTRAVYVSRDQRATESQTERLSKTVKIGPDGELVVSNVSGDIIVTKGSGAAATIDIVKTARARTAEEAKQMLGMVQVEVIERGTRAEITTRYERQEQADQRWTGRRSVNVSVDYTIAAPVGTRLTIKSISGDVKVTDIKGELAVGVASGNITIANAGRIRGAKAMSGDVLITDAQMDALLDVDSVSGDVVVRRVRAARVAVGSISGTVILDQVECDRAEAHSMSGNVEFTSPLAKNGRYEFKSHSGNVRVTVAAGSGFELEANSFTGSFRSDLPMTVEGSQENVRGPGRRSVRGVFGDGSAMLTITTFSGSIVITSTKK